MSKNKTTNQVLGDMIRKFARQQKEDSENFQKTLDFVREVCDAGLVDDVEPSQPIDPDKPLVCAMCQSLIDSETFSCDCLDIAPRIIPYSL
jgi:hypothetical protein